jgi:hypothetical protein
MGKKKAPPPPDYAAAARAQAEESAKAANLQTFANRPDQVNPYGSVSWTPRSEVDPATGQTVTRWSQQTSLNPQMQAALDAQMGLQNQRTQLASSFMDRVRSDFSQPFNFSGMPARQEMSGYQTLDTGLGDYGSQLSMNVGPRSVTRGFDFAGPQMSVDSRSGQIQSTFADAGGPQMSIDPRTGEIQRGVQNTTLNSDFNAMQGGLARQINQENLQRSLNFADNPAMPVFDASYRDRVASDLMQRMSPVHERQRAELETNLANRGFQIGSDAYTRALEDLNKRQAGERFNALDMAGGEAQRLFNMGMGSRQQAFQEDVTGGQFANSAAQQAFNQGLTASQFQNAATGQAFQQDMGARQAANQALGQQFNQNLQTGNFANSATQQAFQQALNAGQFGNQAQQQLYNQALNRAQFGNQAAQQAFQQDLSAGQFGNQAQNQMFGQRMSMADLANRASQQEFAQDLASQQFRNQALGQASDLGINRMNAMNAARAQQQALQSQFAGFQNNLRQQAIQEEMARRGASLNEMNALLQGQNVQMPTFGSFQGASLGQTPNLFGAAQSQYDAEVARVNAANAGRSGLFGGLFGLGAAALGGPAGSLGSKLFGF